jgi:hypothetical protein
MTETNLSTNPSTVLGATAQLQQTVKIPDKISALNKPHKNQHNKTKQLRIDTTVSSGYTHPHRHGLGIWNNPRVPFTVRVDKQLKLEFNKASKAFSGSTCSAIEYIMAAYVGVAKTQQINGVYPTLTMNPITIGEIKIERNVRPRRNLAPTEADNVAAEVLAADGNTNHQASKFCEIGECTSPAVETGVYHAKGKAPVEYRVCAACATKLAECSAWSFKK